MNQLTYNSIASHKPPLDEICITPPSRMVLSTSSVVVKQAGAGLWVSVLIFSAMAADSPIYLFKFKHDRANNLS
jgi:hypothetical protein